MSKKQQSRYQIIWDRLRGLQAHGRINDEARKPRAFGCILSFARRGSPGSIIYSQVILYMRRTKSIFQLDERPNVTISIDNKTQEIIQESAFSVIDLLQVGCPELRQYQFLETWPPPRRHAKSQATLRSAASDDSARQANHQVLA